MLRNLIFLIALAIIGHKLYELVWPFVDPEGVVEQGSYRGLAIGDTKAETITALGAWTSRLRLNAYYVGGQAYSIPSVNPQAENNPSLSSSDKWLLVYPGIHKETIVLTFDNDRLAAIKYRRDAFAP